MANACASEKRLICSCANTVAHEGFYPCDIDGHALEGSDLRCCQRCGKITEAETGKPVGQRSFALSVDDQAALG